MTDSDTDFGKFIKMAKQELKTQSQVELAFQTARNSILSAVEEVVDLYAKGSAVVPELSYEAIKNGAVSNEDVRSIKRRGCLIGEKRFQPSTG